MKLKYVIIVVLLLIIAVIGTLIIKFNNDKLVDLQNQNKILIVEEKTLNDENTDLKNKLIEAENIIANLTNEIVVLNNEIEYQKTKITSLENEEKEVINEEVSAHKEVLNEPIEFVHDNTEGRFYYKGSEFINSSYSIKWPMNSVGYIYEYLDSFKKLTDLTKDSLSQEEKASVDNLDWSIQVLGFHNHMLSIEGGIRDLEFILAKLDYELSIKKFEDGEIDQSSLNEISEKYLDTKSNYEDFINDAMKID